MSQKLTFFVIFMSICLFVSIKMYTFARIYNTKENIKDN